MSCCEKSMTGDGYKTIWSSRAKDENKKWGIERHIGALGTIQAKILYVKRDKSTSLKYYKTKDEVLYVKEGKILVEYDSEKYHYQDKESRALKKQILSVGEVFICTISVPI